MKKQLLTALIALLTISTNAQQKIIQLYPGTAPGSEDWNYTEKEVASPYPLTYNVSHPTLTEYLPDPAIANGTAVIVCPGGGFYVLSNKSEGSDVAKWLNQKGVTVFLLKYRLAHSLTDNPGQELSENMKKSDEFKEKIKSIIPFSIADGKEAIKYVRSHAADYKIDPNRIGIMGFSAGGTVAAGAAFNYNPANKPDFVAPVYAYFPAALQSKPAADSPPMFLCAATDDQLNLASHSVDLYSKWLASKHTAELHIYQKGGHGFGMNKQNIPTDTWIDRFGDWLNVNGWLTPTDPKVAEHLTQLLQNSKAQEEQFRKDWANIKRYETVNASLPAPGSEKRVVFMGNSITEGWIYADPSFFANRPYIDRGISGQTTGQMLVRFREDVINLKPAVVVILAGINDIAENNGPSKIEDVFGNIASMAELAKAAHIKVVLSSVMPAFNFPWRLSIDPVPKIKALNEMLKAYAEKNSFVYLDYFTAMADSRRGLPSNLSRDGVHPNLDGYKIMEPLAEKAIDAAMKGK